MLNTYQILATKTDQIPPNPFRKKKIKFFKNLTTDIISDGYRGLYFGTKAIPSPPSPSPKIIYFPLPGTAKFTSYASFLAKVCPLCIYLTLLTSTSLFIFCLSFLSPHIFLFFSSSVSHFSPQMTSAGYPPPQVEDFFQTSPLDGVPHTILYLVSIVYVGRLLEVFVCVSLFDEIFLDLVVGGSDDEGDHFLRKEEGP